MVWPDDHHAVTDWGLEHQSMRFEYAAAPSADADVHMARPPPDVHTAATLTYSASCPSFTALYELSSDDDLIRDIQASGALHSQHHHQHHHPQHQHVHGSGQLLHDQELVPHFASDKSYDFLLQMQHEHLDPNLRQFPHQQTHFQGDLDQFALFNQPRRPLHASASFTSLSSMETEFRRQSATKRKKAGGERWHKMQRHKSFDSTTTSPATSMEFSTYSGSSQFESTPEHNFLEEVPDADMIGFSIDDFPSTFTSDASWPMPLSLGGGIPFEAYTVDDGSSPAVSGGAPSTTNLLGIASSEAESKADDASAGGSQQSSADIDLLLSDSERAHMSSLFDAIRDFEVPPDETSVPAAPSAASPPSASAPAASTVKKTKEKRAPGPKRRTHSPPLHPLQPRANAAGKRAGNASSKGAQKATKSTGKSKASKINQKVSGPKAALPSLRDRLQQLLLNTRGAEERTTLCDAERQYLESSPLFLSSKALETAGSLWLILHAARRCEFGCEIAGCNVMRRVVKHCLSCDTALGECKDPCNEAKAMMLHYGSCAKDACVVCHKMRGIDQAHHASKHAASPAPASTVPAASLPFLPIPLNAGAPLQRVPIAPQTKAAPSSTSATSATSSYRPLASAGAKPVAIQPNPLPTVSNPMGLIGGPAFPHFGFALSLYLEQTSATFRAEVTARVEKRVTAAAGQDLIQHMQKKTRLRSLDDLRADARTLVLGELERELHLHMQAYAWAANNQGSGDAPPQLGDHDCMLPPYLLSVAAAGFAAFYAQQASLHAALSGMGAAAAATTSRRKPSISSSSAAAASTSAASPAAKGGSAQATGADAAAALGAT